MRIAVISDIHGNLPALEAVAADFASRAVDEVVNLGDSLSGPLMPRETAAYLMDRLWRHIAGNHDRQLIRCDPRDMIPSDQLVVNPGSVGLQAYDDDSPEYHLIETGSPEARYALIERIGESWSVEFVAVAYDYESVVALARRNGRPDWAAALASGFMPR
jgi:predicted phosphodiesterase